MKFFITIVLMIAIQLANSSDYEDDAALYGIDEADFETDDSPKPIYDINEAPKLFEEFIVNYTKTYKDKEDYMEHYQNFKETLKEINKLNSDKQYSSTSDINLFSDFSPKERESLLGVGF